MLELPIKDIKPGMVLATDVLTARDITYLRKGTVLTRQYIKQLAGSGIGSVSVFSGEDNYQMKDLSPRETLIETRVLGLSAIDKKLKELIDSHTINPDYVNEDLHQICKKALDDEADIATLTKLRVHDKYTFLHSIGVAIISGIIGKIENYDKSKLSLLVRCGMLHDVGKLVVPPEILNKPGKLTDEEFAVIKLHPTAGWSELNQKTDPSHELLAAVALQHHERLDGTGYPDKLKEESIHPFSSIVAIADVYDALTSERSYKLAYKPHIAYKIMTRLSRGQFVEPLLREFFDQIEIYAVGSVIETSEGYAIVKSAKYGSAAYPRICVFATERYQLLDEPYEVDLSKDTPISISSVLEDISLIALSNRLRINPMTFLENDYPEKNF